jgi:serine protease DegS
MPQIVRYLVMAASLGGLLGLAVVAWVHRPNPMAAGFADAVEDAEPSVVTIYSSKAPARRNPICELPRYRELCDHLDVPNRPLPNSLGSGVIVRGEGYILTNAHVIADAEEILVKFFDGQTTSAEIIGTDPETDLAVIRANATGLKPIKVGSSDDARVGDIVLAIGNPFGIGQTVSLGIISAKGRYGVGDNESPYEDFLQTDAAINPGNSGGALTDVQGRLLGINSLFYSQNGGSQGIGFAIPVKLAFSVLDEIIAEGRVTRGWLGISINRADASSAVGLTITSVVPDSPAAKAGVKTGDAIVSINDQPATSARAVTRQISVTEPGTDLTLGLLRSGERLEVNAIAGVRPTPVPK